MAALRVLLSEGLPYSKFSVELLFLPYKPFIVSMCVLFKILLQHDGGLSRVGQIGSATQVGCLQKFLHLCCLGALVRRRCNDALVRWRRLGKRCWQDEKSYYSSHDKG